VYGPAAATATPSSLASLKIQNGLTFLVPAYPGCPGKETVERVSVYSNMSVTIIVSRKSISAAIYQVNLGQLVDGRQLLSPPATVENLRE